MLNTSCHCSEKSIYTYWCICGVMYGACCSDHGSRAALDLGEHVDMTKHNMKEYFGAVPYVHPRPGSGPSTIPILEERKLVRGDLAVKRATRTISPEKGLLTKQDTSILDKYRWQVFCLLWSVIGWTACAKDGHRWCSSCEGWNDNYPGICWCSPGWDV